MKTLAVHCLRKWHAHPVNDFHKRNFSPRRLLKANFESLTSEEVFSEAAYGQTCPEDLLHIKAADVSVSGISQTLNSEGRERRWR